MPPAFAFDTLKAADALIAAGINPAHARAITGTMNDAVTEGVATKSDIVKLEAGIAELRVEVKADAAEVKTDTARLEAGLAEVKADTAKLETGLAEVKADTAKLEAGLAEVKADTARIKTDVGRLEAGLAELKTDVKAKIDTDVGALRSELNVHRWVLGLNAAVVLLMAGRMFDVY